MKILIVTNRNLKNSSGRDQTFKNIEKLKGRVSVSTSQQQKMSQLLSKDSTIGFVGLASPKNQPDINSDIEFLLDYQVWDMSYVVVNKGHPREKEVLNLIELITNPENYALLARSNGLIPTSAKAMSFLGSGCFHRPWIPRSDVSARRPG